MSSSPVPLSPIPYFDFGSTGQPLHFLHANGYPPECYQPFLALLQTQYHVFGMYLRPLWKGSRPRDLHNWHPLTDDLLNFLSAQPAPVIGVGHSIGAVVTLRAALRDPAKFKALVLLDPVLMVPRFTVLWNIVRSLGLGDRLHPLIPGAKRRRRTFDDLDALYHRYRDRDVFRYMSDESLRAFIKGTTRPTEDGNYELVYSPDWETQIYRTWIQDWDIWRALPNLKVPSLFIRGAETDTFLEPAAKLVKRKNPGVHIEVLEKSTHILPLERPKEVFDIMQSFLESISME